jgi:hypothetical protein
MIHPLTGDKNSRVKTVAQCGLDGRLRAEGETVKVRLR